MPSDLDRRLEEIRAALTAHGAPFDVESVKRDGASYPAFRHAPRSLPTLFAHFCAQHADREFLVDGNVRLTFAQAHQLARRLALDLIAMHGSDHAWKLDPEARSVLRLLASGSTVREIAAQMHLTRRRVYWVCEKMRARFDAATNEHLISRAAAEGFAGFPD